MNLNHDAKFGIMKNNIVYCDPRHLFHKHWMLDPKKLSLLIFEIHALKLHIANQKTTLIKIQA
jgi:hypothetical protein